MKNKNSSLLRRVALLAGVLVGFPCLTASLQAAAGDLHHTDKNFIEKAAKAGMEEVAISQVAVSRSTNPQVKDFAQMMVTDHTAANEGLARIAAAKGVMLPAKDTHENKWAKRDAKDFDQEYISKMVDDHDEAVKLFTKEANDGKDAEVVAFARKTLPKLQHHQEQAKDLKRMMK
jgi:putative membrane protein